jgi:hypothetical protein
MDAKETGLIITARLFARSSREGTGLREQRPAVAVKRIRIATSASIATPFELRLPVMGVDPRNAASEKNWRLRAELVAADSRSALEDMVGFLRSPAVSKQAKALDADMPKDVVITHDGERLFAYAADEATILAVRRAIESTAAREGLTARAIGISHWDTELDDWRQIDPPPTTPEQKEAAAAAERDATLEETRTLVASAGRLVRAEFEQSLLEWASELGVRCKVFEHPHLLKTQVGFTVTGPKRKLDEFAQGLEAEERAIFRTERAVMLSPL